MPSALSRLLQALPHRPSPSLNPPATPTALLDLRLALSLPLPETFLNAYRTHDGEAVHELLSGVFLGLPWLPVTHVLEQHRTLQRVAAFWASTPEDQGVQSVPTSAVRPLTAHQDWLPFAGLYTGDHLALDYAPGPEGQAGQVIAISGDRGQCVLIAPTFEDFLEFVARAYEGRQFHAQFGPQWTPDRIFTGLTARWT